MKSDKKSALWKYLYGGRTLKNTITVIMFALQVLSVVLMCVVYFTKAGVPEMTRDKPEFCPAYIFSGGSIDVIASDSDTYLCVLKRDTGDLLVLLNSDGMAHLQDESYMDPIYGRVLRIPQEVITILQSRFGQDTDLFGSVYLDTTEVVYSPYIGMSLKTSLVLTFIVLILFITDAAHDHRLYKALSALETEDDSSYGRLEEEIRSMYNVAVGRSILITKSFYIDRKRGIVFSVKSIEELQLKERKSGKKVKSSALYVRLPDKKNVLLVKGKCVGGSGIANAVEKLIKARM